MYKTKSRSFCTDTFERCYEGDSVLKEVICEMRHCNIRPNIPRSTCENSPIEKHKNIFNNQPSRRTCQLAVPKWNYFTTPGRDSFHWINRHPLAIKKKSKSGILPLDEELGTFRHKVSEGNILLTTQERPLVNRVHFQHNTNILNQVSIDNHIAEITEKMASYPSFPERRRASSIMPLISKNTTQFGRNVQKRNGRPK